MSLECLESPKQLVVLRVADLRTCLVVVQVRVTPQFNSEGFDLLEDFRRDVMRRIGHGRSVR